MSKEQARQLRQERDPSFGAKQQRKRKPGLGSEPAPGAKRSKAEKVTLLATTLLSVLGTSAGEARPTLSGDESASMEQCEPASGVVYMPAAASIWGPPLYLMPIGSLLYSTSEPPCLQAPAAGAATPSAAQSAPQQPAAEQPAVAASAKPATSLLPSVVASKGAKPKGAMGPPPSRTPAPAAAAVQPAEPSPAATAPADAGPSGADAKAAASTNGPSKAVAAAAAAEAPPAATVSGPAAADQGGASAMETDPPAVRPSSAGQCPGPVPAVASVQLQYPSLCTCYCTFCKSCALCTSCELSLLCCSQGTPETSLDCCRPLLQPSPRQCRGQQAVCRTTTTRPSSRGCTRTRLSRTCNSTLRPAGTCSPCACPETARRACTGCALLCSESPAPAELPSILLGCCLSLTPPRCAQHSCACRALRTWSLAPMQPCSEPSHWPAPRCTARGSLWPSRTLQAVAAEGAGAEMTGAGEGTAGGVAGTSGAAWLLAASCSAARLARSVCSRRMQADDSCLVMHVQAYRSAARSEASTAGCRGRSRDFRGRSRDDRCCSSALRSRAQQRAD